MAGVGGLGQGRGAAARPGQQQPRPARRASGVRGRAQRRPDGEIQRQLLFLHRPGLVRLHRAAGRQLGGEEDAVPVAAVGRVAVGDVLAVADVDAGAGRLHALRARADVRVRHPPPVELLLRPLPRPLLAAILPEPLPEELLVVAEVVSRHRRPERCYNYSQLLPACVSVIVFSWNTLRILDTIQTGLHLGQE